ncbi:MAG: hypothetical protein R3F60_12005 [bacterium]
MPADDAGPLSPERLAASAGPAWSSSTPADGGGVDVSASAALRLITAGVPVAVGMRGRVKDRACRLFTWQLYRALAAGALGGGGLGRATRRPAGSARPPGGPGRRSSWPRG